MISAGGRSQEYHQENHAYLSPEPAQINKQKAYKHGMGSISPKKVELGK